MMQARNSKTQRLTKLSEAEMRGGGHQSRRNAILEVALALIDKEGIKAMTMRRLGQELGVEAMSIYHYFEDREELLDGIVEAIILEAGKCAGASRKPDEDWKATAKRIVNAYRAAGKRHPNAFQLVAHRPLRTKAAISQGKELVDAFSRFGLHKARAIVCYRAISCFTAGFVLLETSNARPAFTTGNFTKEFNDSLDIILNGVEAGALKAKAAAGHQRR